MFVGNGVDVDIDGFFAKDNGGDGLHFAAARAVQELKLPNEEALREVLLQLQSANSEEAKTNAITQWFSSHGATLGVGAINTLATLSSNPLVIQWLSSK